MVALESVSYRRESRLEVILSTIATRPQPAASCVSVSASSCPSVEGQVQKQLDALTLQPGMQVSPRGADAGAAVESGAATAAGCEVAAEEQLHAALDCARLGDWSVLHTCLMELLV